MEEKTDEKTLDTKPEERNNNLDLQPIINELAPHSRAIVDALFSHMKGTAEGNMIVERHIIWLAFLIVGVAGAVSFCAVFKEHYDTAERVVIPLLSFAGGLGIGSRMTRKSSEAK